MSSSEGRTAHERRGTHPHPGPERLVRRPPGPEEHQPGHPGPPDHRHHRALGLRQDDAAQVAQPPARHGRRGAHRRAASSSTARTSTGREPRSPASARRWACCPRSPRSCPCRSTRTSPTVRASTASDRRATSDRRVEHYLKLAGLWDEVKDRLREPASRPLGRPAAAALPGPGPGRRAGDHPRRRADLGPRPPVEPERRAAG